MHAEDRPLRIALLAYRGKPHVGGQGVYVRHLSKALADLGHHVEVLGGQPFPVLDERVPLVELPSLDIYNDHFPMRATVHHPITVDRRLEIEHAESRYRKFSLARWYSFTSMQTRVARRLERVVTVSESSFNDIVADHQVDPAKMAI